MNLFFSVNDKCKKVILKLLKRWNFIGVWVQTWEHIISMQVNMSQLLYYISYIFTNYCLQIFKRTLNKKVTDNSLCHEKYNAIFYIYAQ